MLVLPHFGDQRPRGATDFNDMEAHLGHEAVRRVIEVALLAAAKCEDMWPDPQSLTPRIEPIPFPLESMPPLVKEAIFEVQSFTQAPLPLVASSALAAMSIVTQAHADVRRAEGLSSPISLFLIAIAEPGERKTTSDKYFMKPIREHEASERKKGKKAARQHQTDTEVWNIQREKLKDKMRLAQPGAPKDAGVITEDMTTAKHEEAFHAHEEGKPEKPRVVRMLFNDATPESLADNLANRFPCGAVASAEAGSIIGGHSMAPDFMMRTLSLFDTLWDGEPISYDRKTSESYQVERARLTISMMVQPKPMQIFIGRNGGLARGLGFLSRCLITYPESTQGKRFYAAPPASWPNLSRFQDIAREWLSKPISVGADGQLSELPELDLAPEAQCIWEAFYNRVEAGLGGSGEYFDVRDLISKAPDNAARIAAIIHLFNGEGGPISAKSMQAGIDLCLYYANEMKRVFADFSQSSENTDASALSGWLIRSCIGQNEEQISRRRISQYATPGRLRNREVGDKALHLLQSLGHVRICKNGQAVEVNPKLLAQSKGAA